MESLFYSFILRFAVNDGDNMNYLLLYLKDNAVVSDAKSPATFKTVP